MRRLAASMMLVATSLVFSGNSVDAVGPERIGGTDRFDTAALIAEQVLDESSSPVTAVLVTGINFPDALAAGVWHEPSVIVPTRTDVVPWSSLGVLADPRVNRVVIVGGTAVVSAGVESFVRGLGKTVTRVAGADRYATSIAVVDHVSSSRVSNVWLAPGTSFVDQMNAMSLAARHGGAMALLPPNSSTMTNVLESLSPHLAVGATLHVVDSEQILPSVSLGGAQVETIVDSPYEVSADGVTPSTKGVVLASGENWPDALAASRLASASTPLVLSRASCVPQPVHVALRSSMSRTVVGGPAALSSAVLSGTRCAVGERPSVAPLSTCQVPDVRNSRTQPYSVGFPLAPGADGTPATGRFPVVVFPVDFADVPGQSSDVARMRAAVSEADRWITTESGGALTVEWRVSDEWIHLPRPSIEYDTPKGGADYIPRAVAVASEIIRLADPTTNFSGNPFVFFVFPSTLRDIDTDVGYFSAQIATGEGRVAKFFGWGLFGNQLDPYGNGEFRQLWSFWIHEIGHTWGLAGHAPANVFGSNQLSPDLHIMDNQDGAVKLLSAWDKFLMGWMNARDIHCSHVDDVTSFDVRIVPRQSPDRGHKAVMIRLSASRILVIESHRPVGYGARLAPHPGGVAAYVVDTSADNDRSGEGMGQARARYAQYLAPVNPAGTPSTRAFAQALIVTGGTARYENITLTVVAGGATDTVRIQVG
ncbi:MAG: cell wall-binding repeat-containing protein [Actinomycetota bacterium]